jgi:cytochrome c
MFGWLANRHESCMPSWLKITQPRRHYSMMRISSRPWKLLVPVAMVAVSLVLSACGGGGGQPTTLPTQPPAATKAAATAAPATGAPTTGAAAAGDPAAGKQAIAKYGCGRCHTIPGIDGANGTIGPNLAGFAKLSVIAGTSVSNTPENDVKWVMNPPSVKPGTQMPVLGVTQTDAENITAFLRTLQ